MDAPVLLTGATGYIGGRLLRRFEEDGRAVRCLARPRANRAVCRIVRAATPGASQTLDLTDP